MLGNLSLPGDLKKLNVEDLENICQEIRQEIISVCLKNGGHLGASLGAVEIAVALHRIFNSPTDKIIWDVGHQAYAHKLLTGRASRFSTLRQRGGLSGFLLREESPHDVYGAGHSSTALSAALGFAYRSDDWTIAVVGDGGMTAGVALEALNNFQSPNDFGPMLVILNDNQMSISENVGGIPHLLSNGQGADFFQMFGLEYVGPLNGHDLPTLLATINGVKTARPRRPVLLHLLTQKGKGYSPAEAHPALFHGVGPAQVSDVSGKTRSASEGEVRPSQKTWSEVFCDALINAAEKDPKIVAITAAMADGTGLLPFAKKFPDRFFDVGIAEPHAVTFAAGLAANGWKPVCAVYSTFLQRGFDALIHDVALQNLPVIFAVDRAGIVGADGPTHHGVFDLAYAGLIPGLSIFTPATAEDLTGSIHSALQNKSPSFIRFPRGKAEGHPETQYSEVRGLSDFSPETRRLVICFGPVGNRIKKLVGRLTPEKRAGIALIQIIHAKPISPLLIKAVEGHRTQLSSILFFEEGIQHGSLSSEFSLLFPEIPAKFFNYKDQFLSHGTVSEIEKEIGFSDEVFFGALNV